MSRHLKLFFHDNCFDGASSAAIFADYYQKNLHPGSKVTYQGVQHQQGDPFAGLELKGDDNACVDFRYCASPKMTWWFDHHVSAFQPEALREHFEASAQGQKFFDPKASSCARFMAEILRDQFSHDFSSGEHWEELIEWADIVDRARFESAQAAVDLARPAMQLVAWIEQNHDAELSSKFIRQLGHHSLSEIAALPWIKDRVNALVSEHESHVELIRSKSRIDKDVVFFDLTDDKVAAHNKFISYFLYPDCHYTVGLTLSPVRVKVSVGSNPWKGPCEVDIARICEQYGGGGHPVVGAVSLPIEDVARARDIAKEIATKLRGL